MLLIAVSNDAFPNSYELRSALAFAHIITLPPPMAPPSTSTMSTAIASAIVAAAASTRGKTCNPPGVSRQCTPACMPQFDGRNSVHQYDSWCIPGGPTDHWCEGRPWRPQDVGKMLARDKKATQMGVHSTQHGRTYNEVVIDGFYSNRNLPHSIEAFVASYGDDLELVRRTHSNFLSAYNLQPRDVPLLIYHPGQAFGCVVC